MMDIVVLGEGAVVSDILFWGDLIKSNYCIVCVWILKIELQITQRFLSIA